MNQPEKNKNKLILFTFLYVSEGAPIGFIWWALPVLLRIRNISIDDITTLTAVLILPWIFKFLWAPLVDSLQHKFSLKSWIITSQLLMGFTIIPLIFIPLEENFTLIKILLFIHSFSAATQDVSVDALAIKTISEKERGKLNGFMQAGMLLGRSAFGGGALLISELLGWNWIFVFLVITIWSSLILVIFTKEEKTNTKKSISEFNEILMKAFYNKSTWLGIGFALTAGAAFETLGALAGPYLIDKNISQSTVGLFFGVFGISAMLIGGIVGGKISDKLGRIKSVAVFLTALFVSVIVFSLNDIFFNSGSELQTIILLTIIYLFIGMFTSSSYALFMDLSNPKIGATQFSTFMAATNGCESWSSWSGGKITSAYNFSTAFIVLSLASLIGFVFLSKIRKIFIRIN